MNNYPYLLRVESYQLMTILQPLHKDKAMLSGGSSVHEFASGEPTTGTRFNMAFCRVTASLLSAWLLWWPPAESHYNMCDHSAIGYVSHADCIVLLCSAGNKITTATTHYKKSHELILISNNSSAQIIFKRVGNWHIWFITFISIYNFFIVAYLCWCIPGQPKTIVNTLRPRQNWQTFNRRRTIIWGNNGLVYWRIYASFDIYQLIRDMVGACFKANTTFIYLATTTQIHAY